MYERLAYRRSGPLPAARASARLAAYVYGNVLVAGLATAAIAAIIVLVKVYTSH